MPGIWLKSTKELEKLEFLVNFLSIFLKTLLKWMKNIWNTKHTFFVYLPKISYSHKLPMPYYIIFLILQETFPESLRYIS